MLIVLMDNKQKSRIDITSSAPEWGESIATAINSDSGEHSSGAAAPSIVSATSAGYSDTEEVMSEELCERDPIQNIGFLIEQTCNEYSSSGLDVDEKHTMLHDASIFAKTSDDDGSFHSIIHSQWENASQTDDHEYASDYTDGSNDSFGPLRPKRREDSFRTVASYDSVIYQPVFLSGAKRRNVRYISNENSSKIRHEIHVDSHRCRQNINRQADMMYSSLSVSCSSDSDNRNHVDLLHSPSNAKGKAFHSVSIQEPPHSPIPLYIQRKSRQARAAIKKRRDQARSAFLKHKEAYKSYRVRRRAAKQQQQQPQPQQKKSRIIVIPSNHKLKILWDMATITLTFVSAYVGHIYIRDRSTYEWDWFVIFTNIWFFIDLLLNFFTEHRTSDGTVMKTGREVWGRYLTTWFAIDALSLLPWERMFLRPIIQKQKRRNIVVKWFFRSKAVIKVTRILKGRHVKAFGRVANNTKRIGIGGKRLLQLIIKYVPKYILFYRNMKGVLVLKILRQIHFLKKVFRGLKSNNPKQDDISLDTIEYDDLSEFDSNEFDDFEDDYDEDDYDDDDHGEEDEEEREDSEDDNDELSHFNSMETDYESCFDDEDCGLMKVNASHYFPRIRRRVGVLSVDEIHSDPSQR